MKSPPQDDPERRSRCLAPLRFAALSGSQMRARMLTADRGEPRPRMSGAAANRAFAEH
jgi:hypothetical protein